jgi:GT2 family glycosyltransferase
VGLLPKVGVVIGTFERTLELNATLKAILQSSLLPVVVVVVDSSNEATSKANRNLCDNLSTTDVEIHHLECETKSVTVQRNKGLDFLKDHEIDYIQILDDDTCPSVELLADQAKFLDQHPMAVGVSGVAPNYHAKKSSGLIRLPFIIAGLDSFRAGAVSRAGVGIPISSDEERPQQVEWLIGCAMWRSSITRSRRFEDSLRGSCLFDDVDYSVRAAKQGSLYVLPKSVLFHSMSLANRPDLELYYYRFSRNRWFVLNSLPRGGHKYISYGFSVVFMSIYLFLKAFLNPKMMFEYLTAIRSTIFGFFDGLRQASPK